VHWAGFFFYFGCAKDTEDGGPKLLAGWQKKMQISTNSYKLFNKKKSNDSFLSCTLHHQSPAGAQMRREKASERPKRHLKKP